MKSKIKQILQIKNDLNDNSINQESILIKRVGYSRIEDKNTLYNIVKQESSVSILNNESSDSFGKCNGLLFKEKTSNEIRYENSNLKNTLKKIIFEKDVRIKDTNQVGADQNSNNFDSRYSFNERIKTKLPNQNPLIEAIPNSNLNQKSHKKTKSSLGSRKFSLVNKSENPPTDKIVSLPLTRDNLELTNINFFNLRNDQSKKILNQGFTSTNNIYYNYYLRGDKNILEKELRSNNDSESNRKNKSSIVLTSSNKLTDVKFTNNQKDENKNKPNNNTKGLASADIKKTKKKLVLANIDRNFHSANVNKIPSLHSRRNPSANKYSTSTTERREKISPGNCKLFSHSVTKNKKENTTTKAFITENHVEKPKWIDSIILDPKDKSINLEPKTQRTEEVILTSSEELFDPEVNAIYNKLFDKYFRKIIDTKTPKTRELQDQIRKYLKLRGKPCYIDDKIKDIKTKIFFIKGIFDFVYPEVLADKLKVQKEYYEIMIKQLQESNKIKQEKMRSNIKNQNSIGLAASEFYVFKDRAKSSKNFYPKIHSAMKSEVKIKTQTKNFFRNLLSSHSNGKKNEFDVLTNLEKFLKMQKIDEYRKESHLN